MTHLAFAARLRAAVGASALALLAGCGGESGCALAPGPCAGDFPAEDYPQPTIQPKEITVPAGDTATFSVLTPGLGASTYQWYRGTAGGALDSIPGATGVSFTIADVRPADDGAIFLAFVASAVGNGQVVQFSTAGKLFVSPAPAPASAPGS